MTAVTERPPAGAPPRRNPALAWARNSWRQLTSMRTALVLLFLLAVAAIPGSVLPQRTVNRENVAAYFRDNPELAPWLDRFYAFDVYSSPWFAAIYLLLFTSLVGCVLPRLAEHVRALRSTPPPVPARLERLPQYAPATAAAIGPDAAGAAVVRALRGFRTSVRTDGDVVTVSAEKGYAKETGNLLFHAALLAVLIGVGFGSWYGWHGNRLLVAGADTGFCNTLPQYDESQLGSRVEPTDLPPFCVRLSAFAAEYQPVTGQPKSFDATVVVDEGGGAPQTRRFSVNAPLRLDGASVYLLGHGYAPTVRFTDRYGQTQTKTAAFLPTDGMQTGEGVLTFPDVNIDPATDVRDPDAQVAFEGLYLPTTPDAPPYTRSVYPAEGAPGLMLFGYRGNLGLDTGIPGSVYRLDRGQIERGKLKPLAEQGKLLRKGDRWTLDDGSTVEFLGTRPWITVSVRHDPAQPVVLAGAVVGLAGLMLSLLGRRRRVFFRITPAVAGPVGPGGAVAAPGAADAVPGGPDVATPVPGGGPGSLIEAGGLPRTDYPGFADEFAALVAAVRAGAHAPAPASPERAD